MSIGIYPHECKPQRVLVNVVVEGKYPVKPQSIAECFNYEHVHNLVIGQWPKRPHIDLLETAVNELLEYIFRSDQRVANVKVCLAKPDIFSEAESVGVETEWTRADFERYCD